MYLDSRRSTPCVLHDKTNLAVVMVYWWAPHKDCVSLRYGASQSRSSSDKIYEGNCSCNTRYTDKQSLYNE